MDEKIKEIYDFVRAALEERGIPSSPENCLIAMKWLQEFLKDETDLDAFPYRWALNTEIFLLKIHFITVDI